MFGCVLYTVAYCKHLFQDQSKLAIVNASIGLMRRTPANYRTLSDPCCARTPSAGLMSSKYSTYHITDTKFSKVIFLPSHKK